MNRLALGFALLSAAACGGKNNATGESLCANQVPPPAACNTPCDPLSGADQCPDNFHCTADGKCDTQCTPNGNECGDGNSCTVDGFCQSGGGNGPPPIDANCPAVHFTAAKTTPTVELLIDQSGSMSTAYGTTDRWTAIKNALVTPNTGIIPALGDKVVFGAALYTWDSGPCPTVTKTKDRKLNNLAEIQALLQAGPVNNTPTGQSIDKIVADFKANPPASGSPPIIVLATDGLPDTCQDPNPSDAAGHAVANQVSVTAAQNAFAAGIRLFFLFVGNDEAGDHPQQMANAGAGLDPKTGKAPFYTALNPQQLTDAFNTIIGGVLSCDLKLSGKVDPGAAQSGTVTLDGQNLTFGTDWNVDADGITLHLLGSACNTLKTAANPTVNATFDCNAVIF